MSIVLCGQCKWRDKSGECTNVNLYESGTHKHGEENQEDHLVYSYNEGGGFWVGEKFGCVHGETEAGEKSA